MTVKNIIFSSKLLFCNDSKLFLKKKCKYFAKQCVSFVKFIIPYISAINVTTTQKKLCYTLKNIMSCFCIAHQ